MKRSKPLRRSKALGSDPAKARAWEERSRRRLPRRSAKRVEQDRQTEALRRAVAARPCLLRGLVSTGLCVGPGTAHHLHKASAGGATDEANLVPLCVHHNEFVEDHPIVAQTLGLVVRATIPPEEAQRRRIAAGIEMSYTPMDPTGY